MKFHQTPWFTPSRELNADDVLWSFQRQRDKEHDWHELAPRGFPYFEAMGFAELIAEIEALDEHRVRFTLKHPEAPFLADLAMGFTSIYSAEYAEQLLDAETPEKLNSQPIGTGPFVFERYAKDAQVRFAGNPHYWGGKPALDRLLLAITPDPNTRIQQLKAGACQVALFPRPSDVPALREHKDLQVLELDSLLTAYVAINTRHKPLDDVRVRQAINLTFDRAAYLRAQFGDPRADAPMQCRGRVGAATPDLADVVEQRAGDRLSTLVHPEIRQRDAEIRPPGARRHPGRVREGHDAG